MVKLLPWDPAEHLETEEYMKEYLEAALELDDSWLAAIVLWDISRAKEIEEIAISAGLDRPSVHKSKKRGDVLDFRAIMQAANALGLRLCAVAESCEESKSGAVGNLNAALARCDAWGAALALRDLAAAMGAESVVPNTWTSAASVRESAKRGEAVDFAIILDAARALGLRIRAATRD